MSLTCEWCNTTFASKSNMTYHQKSAKYCLAIQEKERDVCSHCQQVFRAKNELIIHLNDHIEKFKTDLSDLQLKLDEKDNKYHDLLKRIEDKLAKTKEELAMSLETIQDLSQR